MNPAPRQDTDFDTGNRARSVRLSMRLEPAWWLFAAAVLLGIIAAVLSRQYIESAIAEQRASLIVHEQQRAVVVPVKALAGGEVLSREQLSSRSMPARFVDSHSITEQEVDQVIGRTLENAIDAGRPLLWAHLAPPVPETFSGQVTSGMRALTVQVDEISSIAGLLQPGDRIDLLVSHEHVGERTILPLIDNLLVVATGHDTDVASTQAGPTRRFHTITVEVDPDNAKRIALAQQAGRLTAVLRNPLDDAHLSRTGVSVSDVLGTDKPTVELPSLPVESAEAWSVEYIVGGRD